MPLSRRIRRSLKYLSAAKRYATWRVHTGRNHNPLHESTPERQSLFESHRQRRWLTHWSYSRPSKPRPSREVGSPTVWGSGRSRRWSRTGPSRAPARFRPYRSVGAPPPRHPARLPPHRAGGAKWPHAEGAASHGGHLRRYATRRWVQEKKAGWYAVLEDPQMPVTGFV